MQEASPRSRAATEVEIADAPVDLSDGTMAVDDVEGDEVKEECPSGAFAEPDLDTVRHTETSHSSHGEKVDPFGAFNFPPNSGDAASATVEASEEEASSEEQAAAEEASVEDIMVQVVPSKTTEETEGETKSLASEELPTLEVISRPRSPSDLVEAMSPDDWSMKAQEDLDAVCTAPQQENFADFGSEKAEEGAAADEDFGDFSEAVVALSPEEKAKKAAEKEAERAKRKKEKRKARKKEEAEAEKALLEAEALLEKARALRMGTETLSTADSTTAEIEKAAAKAAKEEKRRRRKDEKAAPEAGAGIEVDASVTAKEEEEWQNGLAEDARNNKKACGNCVVS